MKYFYKDFITGKPRYTRGKFIGWSEPAGPLGVRYAGFLRQVTLLWIPHYLLTPTTKADLPAVNPHQ